jgi:hypothetical protein
MNQLSISFCDDVRTEVGNKVSVMGIYYDELTVTDLPGVLPKIVVVLQGTLPDVNPMPLVNIEVIAFGQVLVQLQAVLNKFAPAATSDGRDTVFVAYGLINVELPAGGGEITVKAAIGNEALMPKSLRVTSTSQSAAVPNKSN